MGKLLSEMTLDKLWELFPIVDILLEIPKTVSMEMVKSTFFVLHTNKN